MYQQEFYSEGLDFDPWVIFDHPTVSPRIEHLVRYLSWAVRCPDADKRDHHLLFVLRFCWGVRTTARLGAVELSAVERIWNVAADSIDLDAALFQQVTDLATSPNVPEEGRQAFKGLALRALLRPTFQGDRMAALARLDLVLWALVRANAA